MGTDPAAITDAAMFEKNGEPHGDVDPADFDQGPDAKGPDPAHWDDHAARVEAEFDPGDPGSTRADDLVHDETGAVVEANVVTHVKGPGPEWDRDGG